MVAHGMHGLRDFVPNIVSALIVQKKGPSEEGPFRLSNSLAAGSYEWQLVGR
jgi:hypothetical protein